MTTNITLPDFFGVQRSSWRFKLNNYCHSYCQMCATLCNIPINPNSKLVDRRDKWEMSPKTVELFTQRFEGIGHESIHRLGGGEVTAMPLDKLCEIVEIIHSSNRNRISILTNGYNLISVPLSCLNRASSIVLDDHTINHEHVMRCHRYLKKVYKGRVAILDVPYHWNWDCARKHPKNILQEPCKAMLRSPSVYREAIYPCCMSMHTDGMRGDGVANKVLKEDGWTFYNPNVVEVLRNWRTTLPEYILDKCLTDCPRPYNGICGGVEITTTKRTAIESLESKKLRESMEWLE